MWVEETFGLCQHEDGVESAPCHPQGRIPLQCYCLVIWHASEVTASSAVNLRAKTISPNTELKPRPDSYL